jgi:hypothetical protein
MPEQTRGRGRATGPKRHGGPGASHEDATKPPPPRPKGPPDTPDRGAHSRISGGGGERDIHHTRDPRTKS